MADREPDFSTKGRASLARFVDKYISGMTPHEPPNQISVPVHDSVDDVESPKLGTMVYLTGRGARPEGYWRYTNLGWRSGAQTNRVSAFVAQREVSNGGQFIVTRTSVPEDFKFTIWTAQVTNVQGNQSGLRLQVHNLENDNLIYERQASDGDETVSGSPLAEGAFGAGDRVRVRFQNSSGTTKQCTGGLTFSFEPDWS